MGYPELLILDTEHWFQRLKGQQATCASQGHVACQDAMFVPNLVSYVVEHIRDRHHAVLKLSELCGEISAGVCNSGGGVVPPVFAPLVKAFGNDVLNQLIQARAYDLHGLLTYRYRLLPRPQDNVTVVLQRTRELPFHDYQLP